MHGNRSGHSYRRLNSRLAASPCSEAGEVNFRREVLILLIISGTSVMAKTLI